MQLHFAVFQNDFVYCFMFPEQLPILSNKIIFLSIVLKITKFVNCYIVMCQTGDLLRKVLHITYIYESWILKIKGTLLHGLTTGKIHLKSRHSLYCLTNIYRPFWRPPRNSRKSQTLPKFSKCKWSHIYWNVSWPNKTCPTTVRKNGKSIWDWFPILIFSGISGMKRTLFFAAFGVLVRRYFRINWSIGERNSPSGSSPSSKPYLSLRMKIFLTIT